MTIPNGSSLAAFSHHWIGGDIHGLQAVADTLYSYIPRLQDVVGGLSVTVRDLTADAPDGWQGKAASAFTAHWGKRVKTAAAALKDYVTAVAAAIDRLAVELSQVESALEGQAYEASRHGVRISDDDGTVTGFSGVHGLEQATAYTRVREQALAEADQVRTAGRTGRLENSLSKLLDTRVSNVRRFLAGNAGPGRHVAGNTPRDLQAAADHEPGAVERILAIGDEIPVVDVAATVAGTGVGAYYDIQDGQPPGTAIGDEAIANTAGTAAATGTGYGIGAELGAELGSAAGPVGMAAGAVVGYGVGDLTHNMLTENWGKDIRDHGVIGGTLHGAHHALDQTADDARETATGLGHDAERYWDDVL